MTEPKPPSDREAITQAFRDRAAANRQNFALAAMENKNPDEQVRAACRAGVHDWPEMASLLGRPLTSIDKKLIFETTMWQGNPRNHPAFNQAYTEWEKTQKWE